ncbi:hypothetical protein AB6A40_003356 [Gnathostoma spinigerum]|uniref:Uncharacterized protein n=1 Tax=Gnathostoma spinigerum TaxID=75299 RepID=A0ABD6EBL8_9BILA
MSQMIYNGPLAASDIKFVIGSFNYEAISTAGGEQIRVISTEGSHSRNIDFILDAAHEMIFVMEDVFGNCLNAADLYFLIVPGKDMIKVDPSLYVIGTESPPYRSQSILWKLVRETVVMKWFQLSRTKSIEETAVYGVVAYLSGSLKNEKKIGNDEDFAAPVFAEQLSNALPLEMNERWSHGVDETQFTGKSCLPNM